MIDTNKDGKICKQDLKDTFHESSNDSYLLKMIEEVDDNEDGFVKKTYNFLFKFFYFKRLIIWSSIT
jgi:Ca2+-binding EF-hand superfamily protein